MRRAVRIRRYDTATDASRGRGRRGVMAFLGLWLIAFNVLAATALASGAPSSSGPSFADALGDRIVICTGAGMVVFDRDGNPVEAPSGAPAPLCPFCLPMLQGAADAPPACQGEGEQFRAAAVRTAPLVAAAEAPAPAPLIASTSPRGPPELPTP